MKSILGKSLILLLVHHLQAVSTQTNITNQTPKKNLDKGVTTKTVKTSVTPTLAPNSDKSMKVIIEHPLVKSVNQAQRQPTELDLSIEKLLKEQKEKSALIKNLHMGVDSSSDDIEEEKKAKEEGESKKLKMFLYQRRKFDMSEELLIDLNFGFDLEKKISGDVLSFLPDLGFDKVLINLNNADCVEDMQCSKPNEGKRNTGIYDSKEYFYYDGLSFLGVQRIRPGELSRDEEHNLDHFFTMPMRFYDNTEDLGQNVLGLGPNSEVWKYWASIYNFPTGFINLTLCYYKHHDYILFDSKIDFDNEIIMKVPKDNDVYIFQAMFGFKNNVKDKSKKSDVNALTDQKVNVCIGSEKGLVMKVTPSIMDLIKNSMCRKADECAETDDLTDSDIEFLIKFVDFQNEDSYLDVFLYNKAFVEDHKGELHWKVELINDVKNTECQIILQQEFLKEKYLMISYDLNDPEHLYLGFKIATDSNFSKFDFYFYSILLFLILTIVMMVLFIILNYKINRFIEKEEKEKEKLLQES